MKTPVAAGVAAIIFLLPALRIYRPPEKTEGARRLLEFLRENFEEVEE